MVMYRPMKFGGHKHFGSGDMFSINHVILEDHVIKESCDFIGRSPVIIALKL